MVDRLQTRRKGSRQSSKESSDLNDENNDLEQQQQQQQQQQLLPKTTSLKSSSSSWSDPNAQNIFLDDLIRHSRDNLLRSQQKRKEQSHGNHHKKLDSPYISSSSSSSSKSSKPAILVQYITAHMGLVITLHPKFAIFCLTCLVTLCIFLFVQIAERHQSNLLIDTDYTDTKSVYDLSLGKLDHWCLTGDDDSCDCEDPLEPVSRGENKQWVKAHKTNNEAVFNIVANKDMIDVVFLGETIVETWNGKKIGRNSTKLQNTKLSFEEHFDESQGGSWNGLALGIQGDTSPNVLWRLLHGEMDKNFNPTIWWLVVGTNDLAVQQCSEEIVLLGILRVIEEIMSQKPQATIVVNSILPMTLEKDGRLIDISKYKLNDDDELLLDIMKSSSNVPKEESFMETTTTTNNNNSSIVVSTESKKKKKKKQNHRYTKRKHRKSGIFSLAKSNGMLWPSVLAVNQQLKAFCEKNKDNVLFFDADDIFVDRKEDELFLNLDLISNRGLPTELGHKKWLEEIARILNGTLFDETR